MATGVPGFCKAGATGRLLIEVQVELLGLRVTSSGGASIDECAELAVWLASSESGELTGRLISASTDDFRGLPLRIAEIMAGDAYTLRRVGLN